MTQESTLPKNHVKDQPMIDEQELPDPATTPNTCAIGGCGVVIAEEHIMCHSHWRLVPYRIRNDIMRFARAVEKEGSKEAMEKFAGSLNFARGLIARIGERDEEPQIARVNRRTGLQEVVPAIDETLRRLKR